MVTLSAEPGEAEQFPTLFSPFELGPFTLRNRIVSAPHGTNYAVGGLPSERQVTYYEDLARGGAAMIVAGHWAVWARTMATPAANSATDPAARPGHRRIAEAVHRHGALLLGQLHDGGRQGSSGWHQGTLLAPSPLPDPVVREIPKEIEPHEIAELVEQFGVAAVALTDAGWDGVEILAAQGYMVSQFLSAQSNWRSDRYGGDITQRSSLLLELVKEVRTRIGPDRLLGVRINGDDLVDGGLTPDDAAIVARLIECTGHVDYISVSGAGNENYPMWIADMAQDRAMFLGAAERIRREVSLPLLTATRIKDPAHAERVLAGKAVDMVGMVRALIADPELPNKARHGRVDDIRPCLSCNQGCLGRVAGGAAMSCTVNPFVGETRDRRQVSPGAGRRVLVVGGGPAGLQAAVTATQAGYQVLLAEAKDALGGQLAMAARVASRTELALIIDHLAGAARRLGVDIRLGQRLERDEIIDRAPDAVIIATGSLPLRTGFSSARSVVRAIAGHNLPHVATAHDVLSDQAAVGSRVVVVDDDPHGQATTVAEQLARGGHEVTVVARSATIGQWAGPANQGFVYQRVLGSGVDVLTTTWVDAIESGTVTCSNVYSGRRTVIGCDTVVLATGNRVEDSLYHELVAAQPALAVMRVGDCLAPRKLDEAIREGMNVSFALEKIMERGSVDAWS